MGDRQTLESLLERDPGLVRSDAVMMGAVDFGHHELVEWLMAHGGNVNARASASRATRRCIRPRGTAIWRWSRLLVAAGADLVCA